MTNWDAAEEVQAPAGAFIGWGTTPGQVVTGKVIAFDPAGSTDMKGGACPLLSLELLEPTVSVNKQGQQAPYGAGDLVNVGCGQYNLKASVNAANPRNGDLVRIELTGLEPTKSGGEVKKYSVKIIRGGAAAAAPQTAAAQPQAAAAPATQAAAVPAADDTPPPNFTPEQWAGMDAATKDAIRKMHG